MITEDNFKEVLNSYDFEETELVGLYSRNYGNCVMSVDFTRKRLIYPEDKGLKVHDKTTSNFDHNENFVVFECVCRLLEKGYRPEHIELEPEWKLGHEAKSGKADILVRDENGNPYIIIECKRIGDAYSKEKKNTEEDGGQLFSYWQQEESTKWLALYASNCEGGKVTYKSEVIHSEDDANILKMSEKDESILTYNKAHNNVERFAVWDETYNKEWLDDTIFNESSKPYDVGVPPLFKSKLRDFTPDDKIVNKFEEILRHNNVSDKENAFNRLVALFICKLVDEMTKKDYEVVEFQYIQGSDTYEELQDRLQRLHKQGMDEFMHEEIFYVEKDYADKLFRDYTGHKRKAAIEDLNKTIRILKFYSNNDFAFKDVHNEELFYQNGKILVEMVQLFQPYRIVYQSRHQFLGDLFEQLLNKGFKQNEGQFFTPMPITRFIWDSLPLSDYISHNGLPRVIDYACGAGHFLTEAVEAINAVQRNDNNSWADTHIYGIEKDYRLARVSKISMFMNGAGEANIIFGDGLENYADKGIRTQSFDILVANPPYSVKSFKQHLKLKNNNFELLNLITNDGGEIEVLFVERIAQLLKPKGIAAVVLPASLLSNESSSYNGAREQLLKNFYIHAIVTLGNRTFGATGTNTIILFLERYNEPPRVANLKADSVEAIMNVDDLDDFSDKEIFSDYIKHQNISENDYKKFLKRNLGFEALAHHPYLKVYVDAFNNTTQTYKRNLSQEDKEQERKRRFYEYALNIEYDKLYYFALVYRQHTLVISAPSDNEEQKEFLGYTWSNAKGREGIRILSTGGKLYNHEDRFGRGTLACIVRNTFIGDVTTQIDSDLQKYAHTYCLKDMMDFSKDRFTKAIATTAKRTLDITSQYEIIKLSDLALSLEKGTSITKEQAIEGDYKVVAGGKDYAYTHNEYNREPNVITVSASGTAGYVNLWRERIFASDCTTIYGKSDRETLFLFYYLKSIQDYIYTLKKGANQPHVYADDLGKIPVPNLPINIQEKVVVECEAIDEEYNRSRMSIDENKRKINDIFAELELTNEGRSKILKLSDNDLFEIFIGRRVTSGMMKDEYEIPVYSANVFEPFGKIDKLFLTDFSKDSILWGIDGDWMVNLIEHDIPFYPTDHCGVIRIKTNVILPKMLCYLLQKEGNRVRFSRSYRASTDRVKSLSIVVPPIEKQEEAIAEIRVYEQKIAEAKDKMKGYSTRIKAVLDKYLQ